MSRKPKTKEERSCQAIQRAQDDFQHGILIAANRLLIASTSSTDQELRSQAGECLKLLLRLSAQTVSTGRLTRLRNALMAAVESALKDRGTTAPAASPDCQ